MKSRLGFTLIEVLIAAGIMSVVALGVVSLMKTGFDTQKNIDSMDDARELTDHVAALLSSRDSCKRNLEGENASAGFERKVLEDAVGNAIYEVDRIYGHRALRLSRIDVGGSGHDPKLNLARYTRLNDKQGLLLIKLTWTKVGERSGPAELQRFFFVRAYLENDRVVSCGGLETIASQGFRRFPGAGASGAGSFGYPSSSERGNSPPEFRAEAGSWPPPSSSGECGPSNEGQQRYSARAKTIEVCDGSSWTRVGEQDYRLTSCQGSGNCMPSCPPGYYLVNHVPAWTDERAPGALSERNLGICRRR